MVDAVITNEHQQQGLQNLNILVFNCGVMAAERGSLG